MKFKGTDYLSNLGTAERLALTLVLHTEEGSSEREYLTRTAAEIGATRQKLLGDGMTYGQDASSSVCSR